MKQNISCFFLRYFLNASLFINGVLCLNAQLQGKSRARKLIRMRTRLAVEKCISRWIHHTGKENTKFYAAENTLLHNFHQATCPINHIICL